MEQILNFLAKAGMGAANPMSVLWWLFTHGGFIFVIWAVFLGLREVWLNWRQDLYYNSLKWTYLAIDVPRDSEQSPKAVEHIFSQIWGSITGRNFVEKWWEGKFMPNFSFEIVSIEGYIQYIVRTPTIFRDLVEASIYAQYPDAQITEIEDYTKDITPNNFKQKGYELWGAQYMLVNDEVYPIKTYPLFEHSIAQQIIDPMAAEIGVSLPFYLFQTRRSNLLFSLIASNDHVLILKILPNPCRSQEK